MVASFKMRWITLLILVDSALCWEWTKPRHPYDKVIGVQPLPSLTPVSKVQSMSSWKRYWQPRSVLMWSGNNTSEEENMRQLGESSLKRWTQSNMLVSFVETLAGGVIMWGCTLRQFRITTLVSHSERVFEATASEQLQTISKVLSSFHEFCFNNILICGPLPCSLVVSR